MLSKKTQIASYCLAIITTVSTPLTALASSIYYIGNSLTDTVSYQDFSKLVKQQLKKEQPWGRHMIPGAPLEWIWNHPDQGFRQRPYGHYPEALNNYSWDFLSLQPFRRPLEKDVEIASRFINLAKAQNPNVQVLIHSNWVRRDKQGTSYSELWDKEYKEKAKNTLTRDYINKFTTALQEANPNLKEPIIVPIGEVLYQLDQQMRAGKVPGFNNIFDIYADQIHLDERGKYLTMMTYLATMYRVNPATLDGSAIVNLDNKVKQIFDQTIWQVVNQKPLSNSENSEVSSPNSKAFPLINIGAGFVGVGTAIGLGVFLKRKLSKNQ
ncbi:hypothetical protein PCC7424_4865 [Gloeothece citriformis PCC 7424]|uniref:Uncharacterized protein n=1 Tax=Gloeothece citriformis (strain PCC 7424) TaxID=65393 RepID=B7KEA4_GLOC7|nr:PEP-CTERM sorting domain-containing protein [Gloeothece citriformis]ACK73222.1 hypothetical protein PCC7424_4865 [Gloeothece citriformis PCC 7424]